MNNLCHCGKPLHYDDPARQSWCESVVKRFGPYIDITVDGRTFQVQRHYIALHHIRGANAETLEKLGFKEVTE
jgi:hypothetical protein